ncbi:MAG: TonB family protein [Pseudomonadota bacterium]
MQSLSLPFPRMGTGARQHLRRIGPLGSIILLHVGVFYALSTGLLRQAAEAIPQEVFVSFISPEPAPKPEVPKPQPATPKPVPVVKKPVVRPAPVAPPLATAPSQQAITEPPTAPPSPQPPADVAAPVAPQAPAAPAPPAPPKTISGVEYIQAPQPDYPPIAKRMGEEGKVIVRVLINEKGRPERVDVQKSSGSPRLDEAAKQAVARALFKPHLEDGKPIAVFALVPINFSIQ